MKKLIFLLILLIPLMLNAQARLFDNINDTVEIANESNFDFIDVASSFSIECWVYPTDTGYILHKGLATPNYKSWLLQITNISGLRFRLYFYDGSTELKPYADYIVTLNQWQHLAITYDGSNNYTGTTFYIDGVEYATSGSGSGLNSVAGNNPLYIGSAQDANNYWGGRLDELRIWNYERTQPSDIDKIIADEELGLIGYWRFDELTGGIFDSTENNNHSVSIAGTLSVDNCPIKRIIGE